MSLFSSLQYPFSLSDIFLLPPAFPLSASPRDRFPNFQHDQTLFPAYSAAASKLSFNRYREVFRFALTITLPRGLFFFPLAPSVSSAPCGTVVTARQKNSVSWNFFSIFRYTRTLTPYAMWFKSWRCVGLCSSLTIRLNLLHLIYIHV